MTVTLARHIVGILCWVYVFSAGHAVYNAGTPVSIEWLAKVGLLAVVGAVVGLGPEVVARLSSLKQFIFNLSQTAKQPSIFTPPAAVPPGNPPPPNSGGGFTDAMQSSQLLGQLTAAAKGDPELMEEIYKLNDGLFRKAFQKGGGK